MTRERLRLRVMMVVVSMLMLIVIAATPWIVVKITDLASEKSINRDLVCGTVRTLAAPKLTLLPGETQADFAKRIAARRQLLRGLKATGSPCGQEVTIILAQEIQAGERLLK